MRDFLLRDFIVTFLYPFDGVHKIWSSNYGIERTPGNNVEVHLAKLLRRGSECTRRNNMEVQPSEFFNKRGLNFSNLEVVAVRLAAQGISHYISLAGGI